jgi:DNA-binding NarL/FixJ family response regulator
MINIALVDDHEVVRQGLVSFLSGIEDLNVVGQGSTGVEAIELVTTLQPDILLLDMMLPDMTGLEAFQTLLQQKLTTKVLFLSSFCDAQTSVPAVRSGAAGYLLKDISPRNLITAVRDVYAGKLCIHSDVSALMISELNQTPKADILSEHSITERERQVIQLIGEGFSNKDIASNLNISQLTVKTHVSHILDKLKLDDRTQVAIFAIRNDLVTER